MSIRNHFDRKPDWDCHQVSERLSAYLNDGLSAQQHDAIQQHIASCETCRSELKAAQETEAALRLEAFRHQPKISKYVSAHIQQRVYQALRRGIFIQQTFKFARLTMFATLIVLFAINGDRILRQSATRPKPAAASPEASVTPLPTKTQQPTPLPAKENIVVISTGWEKDQWQRNFNPFSYNGHSFAVACLYEPLMLQNDATDELIPWLATGYRWNDENTRLTLTLRQGVKWSDGQDLHADDVVATFTLLRDHPEISGFPDYPLPVSTLLATEITAISAPDDYTVQVEFKSANPEALSLLVSTAIVPQHEWENMEKPGEFANEYPVGSGPFTSITIFETRQNGMERTVQFERNPYYWQAEKLNIQGVRYSIRHEKDAIEDLQNNQVDWAMLNLSDPQQDFTNLAPGSFHITGIGGSTTSLYLNTSRPPFNNIVVRKAISMAIHREAILALLPTSKTSPADATGLSAFERSTRKDVATGGDYRAIYDPGMANGMLDEIGFTKGPDGIRVGLTGVPMRFVYYLSNQVGQWEQTQTKRIVQLIADDLQAIGIELAIGEMDEYRLWEQIQKGNFDMVIGEEGGGAEWLYFNTMSSTGYFIYGSDKTNAEAKRYFSEAAQPLFDDLNNTTDANLRDEIMQKLQAIFVEDTPILPLYSTTYFYQYNTSRFTGFPSDEARYETGVNIGWHTLQVFLRLKPRK